MRPKVKFMFNFSAAITISFISFARLKFQLDYYCCLAFAHTHIHPQINTHSDILVCKFSTAKCSYFFKFPSEFLLLVNFSTLLFPYTNHALA